MPSIQFYADAEDFKIILDKLRGDAEIAFILRDGRTRWIARQNAQVGDLADGPYCLWHIPGGPLPLVGGGWFGRKSGTIEHPFEGWTQRSGGDPRVPFFGSIPGVVTLGVLRSAREAPTGIGQSYFGWLGDRYRDAGAPAAKETTKWWRRLGEWVSKTAVGKITRWGPMDGPDADIWAFPSAHRQIQLGAHRDVNPMG
ncbi:MAG TPA: hypothetical protein VH518_18770 [Tepidisphaeraceae bacterium]|jgi:hypothetical protein